MAPAAAATPHPAPTHSPETFARTAPDATRAPHISHAYPFAIRLRCCDCNQSPASRAYPLRQSFPPASLRLLHEPHIPRLYLRKQLSPTRPRPQQQPHISRLLLRQKLPPAPLRLLHEPRISRLPFRQIIPHAPLRMLNESKTLCLILGLPLPPPLPRPQRTPRLFLRQDTTPAPPWPLHEPYAFAYPIP